MSDSEVFAAHAARCHQEAAAAVLDNVRDRALRAEAAWTAMANRSVATEAARNARETAKARIEEPASAPPVA